MDPRVNDLLKERMRAWVCPSRCYVRHLWHVRIGLDVVLRPCRSEMIRSSIIVRRSHALGGICRNEQRESGDMMSVIGRLFRFVMAFLWGLDLMARGSRKAS
jgi:hypothetical protein